MLDLLTMEDIWIALLLAAVFTWLVNRFMEFSSAYKKNSLSLDYRIKDLDRILEKCYDLFPKEVLQFDGEIYRRGMKVRIITSQNKMFEGRFLGLNSDNMICLMTRKFIIAHAVKNIHEMEQVE